MAADSDPLEMGPPADDNDTFPMGTGWRLINMGVNAPATARPDADSATEAPSEQPTDLGAMTDLGEVTDCEDVPTPPGVCKKEPMSPGGMGNAMQNDMQNVLQAQLARMVQATLDRMQRDGVITFNAQGSDTMLLAYGFSFFLCNIISTNKCIQMVSEMLFSMQFHMLLSPW
jgi:hypothetical protein